MHPEDVTVSEGGTIVLSIDATGSGNFTYEWKKVGSDSLPDTASGKKFNRTHNHISHII